MAEFVLKYADPRGQIHQQVVSSGSEKELREARALMIEDMAKNLVQHLTVKFKLSEFHDSYRENVQRLIEEKKKGEKITTHFIGLRKITSPKPVSPTISPLA